MNDPTAMRCSIPALKHLARNKPIWYGEYVQRHPRDIYDAVDRATCIHGKGGFCFACDREGLYEPENWKQPLDRAVT